MNLWRGEERRGEERRGEERRGEREREAESGERADAEAEPDFRIFFLDFFL
jgi:hypothetical protein